MVSTDREILIEINGRLIRLESRMDKFESRMDKLESRVGVIEEKLIGIDKRLAVMESQISKLSWAMALDFSILAVLVTYTGNSKQETPPAPQPVIIPPSEPTLSFDTIERIMKLMRNQESSSPANETRESPDKRAI